MFHFDRVVLLACKLSTFIFESHVQIFGIHAYFVFNYVPCTIHFPSYEEYGFKITFDLTEEHICRVATTASNHEKCIRKYKKKSYFLIVSSIYSNGRLTYQQTLCAYIAKKNKTKYKMDTWTYYLLEADEDNTNRY